MKTTHQGFSISFVCGTPGSGKSYCLTHDVIERLSTGFSGKVITNLPLEVDKIAEHVAKKLGVEPLEVTSRIILLDRDTLRIWQDGHGGPWEFAERQLADGNDFMLDECHLFCRRTGQNVKARNERWQKWLGEVRHEGWRRCVFVTQDESKVGTPITQHAELRYELTNSERRRDPILRIPLHYWYELIASVTREYRPSIAVVEYRRVKGKLREQHVERVALDPFWFQFYRSYEAAGGGTGKGQGGSAVVREFMRRPVSLPRRLEGKLVAPTWLWFLRVHWWRFCLACAAAGSLLWLSVFGGMNVLLRTWMSRMGQIASANTPHVESDATGNSTTNIGGGPEQVLTDDGESTEPARPSAEEMAAILARVPETDRGKLVAELNAFADAARASRARFEQLVELRRDERQRVRVVAITEDAAWFTDPPCSCKLGEKIDEGPYQGRHMERLNIDDGWVELSGGIKLWIGRGAIDRLPDADTAGGDTRREARSERAGAVPEPVPALGPGRQAPVGGGLRAADHDHGPGDGLRSVLSRDSAASGTLDRSR
jgi:hypothetical protein